MSPLPPTERLNAWLRKVVTPRRVKIAGLAAGISLGAILVAAVTFYFIYSHRIDRQLRAGVFADSVNVYASPLYLAVGDMLTSADLAAELNIAGYRESTTGQPLTWRTENGRVEIFPPEDGSAPARLLLANNQIAHIQSDGKDVRDIYLASPLITTLSTKKEERLPVVFRNIPPVMVKAVLAAEDKRFFQHDGLDIPRMIKAAYTDIREGRKEQGASTLTMQLVRGLWLEPDKRWRRKLEEIIMTIHLERAWPKEKIFEAYANQIYLGRQADYSVHGFGEAARMFFGKKLRDISLAQAALLAGMVQRPSYFNPFRWPERVKDRRDVVLEMMRHNGYITAKQYEDAINEPLGLTSDPLNDLRAPYFLDLVNELQEKQAAKQENSGESGRNVYSTIDLNLQHAADEAVAAGMAEVDRALGKRTSHSGAKAEVALIALDPRTGEIKALVGGRDYKKSQLNRILSKRPPGSVFKPFVYAAALETAISGGANVYTQASMVDDSPTTFWFDGKPYEPGNFHGERFGTMTFREALAKSDNVAAVKVAQEVGYGRVVRMARRFGLNDGIRATPAVALGTYQVTPFEIARAYTAFANGGMLVNPVVVSSYRNGNGAGLGADAHSARGVRALDPRINWLMVNMLEEVMRSGTAAGVRARGFVLPAAGKTGTSHDGWFAGFTTQLLCVVWVGFDDYTELGLEGARSALPIWTEFMKRASRIGPYRNAQEFPSPKGITQTQICTESGELAGDECENTREAYFVSGTEPRVKCQLHREDAVVPNVASDNGSGVPVRDVVVNSQP